MFAEHGDLEVIPAQPADAAPTGERPRVEHHRPSRRRLGIQLVPPAVRIRGGDGERRHGDERGRGGRRVEPEQPLAAPALDRKSTRLNSSHVRISYAVFFLKKKKKKKNTRRCDMPRTMCASD